MKRTRNIISAVFVVLVCLFTMSILTSCKKADPKYSYHYLQEEYLEDFELGQGRTYYSTLKPGNKNLIIFWGSVCPHCEAFIEYVEKSDTYDEVDRKSVV